MPALEEPPVQQQATSAPVTQQGDLKSLLENASQNPHQDTDFKATPQNPDQAVEQQSTDKTKQPPKPAEKPKVAQKAPETSQKDGKQKGKWAGLEALKTPENAEEQASGEEHQETPTKEEVQAEEDQSPQARRWSELRKIEDTYKTVGPAYEKLQKDFEELKGKVGMTEEQKARFDHLEQMYAVELLDQKPEFQQEVMAPLQEQLNHLKSVADHAGLDANQRQALRTAAENPDAFSRIRSIKQILGASTTIEDPEEIQTLVQFALDASGKYQDAKKKEDRYVKDASELANSVRGKEAQMSVQQKQAKQAEYDTAHKEMIGTLSPPIQPLLDDPEYGPQIKEALESIRPGETPMDQAYQAQAGEILPFTIKKINALLQRVATLEKSARAREAAKPKTTDGTTPQAEQGQQQPDLKMLLNTMQR